MEIEHAVAQGECLSSIAAHYKVADWHTIYGHSRNSEFRRKRPNPHCILPGDKLWVPISEPRHITKPTEHLHPFRTQDPLVLLRLIIRDEADRPFASTRFSLKVGSRTFNGTTNEQGALEQVVPVTETDAELRLLFPGPGGGVFVQWSLKIGHLDPIEEMSGLQCRLNNLGFGCGEVDGLIGPLTRTALRSFQCEYDLPETGEPDERTRSALLAHHGNT